MTEIRGNLSRDEANQLTGALGDSWRGNVDHNNAEVRARRAIALGHPFETDELLEQLERSREAIAPFVGKLATGKTTQLVLHENDEWGEIFIASPTTPIQRATGVIKGIEAHPVRTQTFEDVHGIISEFRFSKSKKDPQYGFRIGVVLEDITRINMGMHRFRTPPTPVEILIPIHDFPRTGAIDMYSSKMESTNS